MRCGWGNSFYEPLMLPLRRAAGTADSYRGTCSGPWLVLDRSAKRRHICTTTNSSRRIHFRYHIERIRDLSCSLVLSTPARVLAANEPSAPYDIAAVDRLRGRTGRRDTRFVVRPLAERAVLATGGLRRHDGRRKSRIRYLLPVPGTMRAAAPSTAAAVGRCEHLMGCALRHHRRSHGDASIIFRSCSPVVGKRVCRRARCT